MSNVPVLIISNNLTKRSNKMPNEAEKVTMRTPFPPHQISKLPKPTKAQTDEVKANYRKGIRCAICGGWHHPDVIHLDYVGHAAITDRLLNVDPSWNWEPVAMDSSGLPAIDKDGGLWIRLTVLGVTRLGYGDAQGKAGGDAMKERIGDALRNAAMRFGAALDLWHKGDLHLDDDDGGKKETPPEPITPPADDFSTEIKILQDCGSIPALSLAWNKLDRRVQYALASVKDQCKNAIIKAEKEADTDDYMANPDEDMNI